MSMITYKVGNLLDATEIYIAHGCNALGVMGAGVAKDIADRYPLGLPRIQGRNCSRPDAGKIHCVYVGDHRTVVNMITQAGVDGPRAVNYGAIALCLNFLYQEVWPIDKVAMPLAPAWVAATGQSSKRLSRRLQPNLRSKLRYMSCPVRTSRPGDAPVGAAASLSSGHHRPRCYREIAKKAKILLAC